MDTIFPLQGKRILVTRPPGQQDTLCSLLQAAGAVAVRFAVIQIEPLPLPEKMALDPAWLIFISANAVHYGRYLLPQTEQSTTQVAVVGEQSAKLLKKIYPGAVLFPPQESTSEGLLALAEFQASSIHDRQVMIVRGLGGREWLGQTLQARGAKVQYVEVYARRLPDITPAAWMHSGDIDAITLTSVESAQNLFTLLHHAPWLCQRTYSVFSPRIASALRALGVIAPIHITPTMNDAGLITALSAYYKGVSNGSLTKVV